MDKLALLAQLKKDSAKQLTFESDDEDEDEDDAEDEIEFEDAEEDSDEEEEIAPPAKPLGVINF